MGLKIFLSWSGEKSRYIAKALRQLLEDVNHNFDPWMSGTDIKAGARWGEELARQLDDTDFGIICLTSESLRSPWLLFEAGALSKSVRDSLVCPYIIDLKQEDIDGPLSQFQGKDISKEGTWELIRSIDEGAGEDSLGELRLQRYFERYWSDFETALKAMETGKKGVSPEIRRKVVNVLANHFPDVRDARMVVSFSNSVPMEMVNWSGPPMTLWSSIVKLADERGRLLQLVEAIAEETGLPAIRDLVKLLPKGDEDK